ncbi:MAG: hypothetical protein HDR96_01180 [Bacteroides sp.]|nr:hypothetical protein [Bacteroides sp.]
MKRAMQAIVIFLCCSVGKIYGTTDRKPSTPAFQLMENSPAWIMKLPHRVFPKLTEERVVINDSILSTPMPEDLRINEQNDTLYIDNIINEGSRRYIRVWSNKSPRVLVYTDSTISSYSMEEPNVYNNLVKSWDTNLLRHIGYEAQPEITLSVTHYLARIIFHKGATQIDTVSFFNLGDVERLTNHQLDSLREVIRSNKLSAKADSREYQTNKDSIPSTISEKNGIEKDSPTINPRQPSPSLWHRIVDWFRRLWNAIFG